MREVKTPKLGESVGHGKRSVTDDGKAFMSLVRVRKIVNVSVKIDNVQTAAQRIGVKVPDGKVETIAETVTAILRNAVDEAKIRAFLAKRSTILPGDIACVLSDYGYTVCSSYAKCALRRSVVLLQAIGTVEPHQYERIVTTGIGVDMLHSDEEAIVDAKSVRSFCF